MWTALAQALATGLSLWKDAEATKYIDKLNDLRRDYYEESNKDPALRSDAVLDNLEFELCCVSFAFSARAGQQNASPQPGPTTS